MIGKLQKRLPILTDDPVELSSQVIDSGETNERTNRITNAVSGITDHISIVESFSHIITFRTDDGLVCFDASGAHTGGQAVAALRAWSSDPVHSLVYTHGHIDHVGGSGAFAADADAREQEGPSVVGHVAVEQRFDRYIATNGWNNAINARQFGGISKAATMGIGGEDRFLPVDVLWPTVVYTDTHRMEVGGLSFELFHDKGETDDHTWAWVPEHKALCVGDFVTWVFPNCGNPQKVQRYPKEWAAALRKMQAHRAEWLFGAHGLPIQGVERVDRVLEDLAVALETLVGETLAMMNDGESLDTILHSVSLPAESLAKPWMQPVYDEPEFVVRNIWRQYGGWWDLDPANLKPAPADEVAREMSDLCGGVDVLVGRARILADACDIRLACHLVELAVRAEPDSVEAHGARAEIYQARRDLESSLMSKGVFAAAANESSALGDRPGSA